MDGRRTGGEIELEGDRLARAVFDQVAHLLDHLVEGHVLGLQRLAARERQQPAREARRARGRAAHALPLHARPAVLVDRGLQQREVAENRAEVVVEVVRDAAGELAQHLELLGLLQLAFDRTPRAEVGHQRHGAAAGHGAAAQVEHLAVRPLQLEVVGLHPGERRQLVQPLVALAIAAAPGGARRKRIEQRRRRRSGVRRHALAAEHLHQPGVPQQQAAGAVEYGQAVGQVVVHGLQQLALRVQVAHQLLLGQQVVAEHLEAARELAEFVRPRRRRRGLRGVAERQARHDVRDGLDLADEAAHVARRAQADEHAQARQREHQHFAGAGRGAHALAAVGRGQAQLGDVARGFLAQVVRVGARERDEVVDLRIEVDQALAAREDRVGAFGERHQLARLLGRQRRERRAPARRDEQGLGIGLETADGGRIRDGRAQHQRRPQAGDARVDRLRIRTRGMQRLAQVIEAHELAVELRLQAQLLPGQLDQRRQVLVHAFLQSVDHVLQLRRRLAQVARALADLRQQRLDAVAVRVEFGVRQRIAQLGRRARELRRALREFERMRDARQQVLLDAGERPLHAAQPDPAHRGQQHGGAQQQQEGREQARANPAEHADLAPLA